MVTWSTTGGNWTTTTSAAYRADGLDTWSNDAISTETETTNTPYVEFVFNSNSPAGNCMCGLDQGQPTPHGYNLMGGFLIQSDNTCSVVYDDTWTNSFTYSGQTLKVSYNFSTNTIEWFKDGVSITTQSHTFTSVNVAVTCYVPNANTGVNTLSFVGSSPPPSSSDTHLPPPPIILERF